MSGYVLHREVGGPSDAPALVLVGSLGSTLGIWQPQLQGLETLSRVIRLDLRGHGDSPVPSGPYSIADLGGDVVATLDELGLERVDYCGLSIGGMIGLWLASYVPERIASLVAISTSAHVDGATNRARAAAVRAAGSPEVVADDVIARWFTRGWAADHPQAVAHYRAMIADTPAEGYASCAEAVAAFDHRHELASITAPTLVIAGAEDEAIPPEQGRLIADRVPAGVPAAQLVVIARAAHLVSVEHADAVTRLIASHLEKPEDVK
jgi:3-oxoadipate enol-lactonase